jgi:hypothetical protein
MTRSSHCKAPKDVRLRAEVKTIIEAQAGFEPQYSSWHGRNHHNFNEHPRSPKVGREASPRRRVCRVDPFVPNSVVIFEQTHVSDPDLGA